MPRCNVACEPSGHEKHLDPDSLSEESTCTSEFAAVSEPWTCYECGWENGTGARVCEGCDTLRGTGLVASLTFLADCELGDSTPAAVAEEQVKRKSDPDPLRRKIDEDAAAKRKVEEEATRKSEEEVVEALRRRADEEAAAKKKNEDEANRKFEEECLRKAENVAAANKNGEDEATRRCEEEEDALRREADKQAAAKKNVEEETTGETKHEEDAAAKQDADEAHQRKDEDTSALRSAAASAFSSAAAVADPDTPADGTESETAAEDSEGLQSEEAVTGSTVGPLETAARVRLKNLARGRPVSASSMESVAFAPRNVVDGNLETRWSSGFVEPAWIAVDLGEAYFLSCITVEWEAAHAITYLLEASLDGKSWMTLMPEVGRAGMVETALPRNSIARLVRVFCEARATKFGFSIYDIRVLSEGTCPTSDELEVAAKAMRRPLDAPAPFLGAQLLPQRVKWERRIQELLAKYDKDTEFPRPLDSDHYNRNGYELHLRGEALKDLRVQIKTHAKRGPHVGQVWTVVGGRKAGGLVVRRGQDIQSCTLSDRLVYGALIEELDLVGERLCYALLRGTGPAAGWISTVSKDNLLVERKDHIPDSLIIAGRAKRAEDPNWADKCLDKELTQGPAQEAPNRIIIIALMAAHIASAERLEKLQHTLRTVQKQRVDPTYFEFLAVVSWHATTPELTTSMMSLMMKFGTDCGKGVTRLSLQQPERLSQFQHMRAGLAVAEAELRQKRSLNGAARLDGSSTWVVFGDDDDLWHRQRVTQYAKVIRSHPLLEGVGAFYTTARVIVKNTSKKPEIPETEQEVDEFIERGAGTRLDQDYACTHYRNRLLNHKDADIQMIGEGLPLEYFDFCPRLRLLNEFFAVTHPRMFGEKYCDLRLRDWLTMYPRAGREMGLEVHYFDPDPHCWMYFYSCQAVTQYDMMRSCENINDALQGFVGTDDGHVSSKVTIERSDNSLAMTYSATLQAFNPLLIPPMISRYLATYRNDMEMTFAQRSGTTLDQRLFDDCVFRFARRAFARFLVGVIKSRRFEAEAVLDRICQEYASSLAERFNVSVLWHKRNIVMKPRKHVDIEDAMARGL